MRYIWIVLFFVAAVCSPSEMSSFLYPDSPSVVDNSVSYVLAIDRSGSMRENNRFSEAQRAASDFISEVRDTDQVGVVGFDSRSFVYAPLSTNKTLAKRGISRMQVGDFTQYHQGLSSAMNLLDEVSSSKVVILLSDGKPDDNSEILDETISSLLSNDVCVYTIAFSDDADEQAQQVLSAIASASQESLGCGEYFRAAEDSFDLVRSFTSIVDASSGSDSFVVDAVVSTSPSLELSIDVTGSQSNKSLSSLACFNPEVTVTILSENKVISEFVMRNSTIPLELPAGPFEAFVRVVERCGGECLYSGSTSVDFTVPSHLASCVLSADQMTAVMSSSTSSTVRITPRGFVPSTVGTSGVVTWVNEDVVPHQIVGLDDQFSSPVLRPGDEWTHVFSPGEWRFVDSQEILAGTVRSQRARSAKTTDLIVVLDKSGSMAGSPLESAKDATQTLFSLLGPGDRASFIVFSDEGSLVSELTSDVSSVSSAVSSVRSDGSTFYVSPLELVGSQVRLPTSADSQLVIFLSDGAPSESEQEVLSTLEEVLGSACLYTIGYGQQGVEAISLLSQMADYARSTNDCGLFYFSSTESSELAEVFGEIYALSTQQSIAFENVSLPSASSPLVSVSLRSRFSGLMLPSSDGPTCLPSAEVELVVGSNRYPLLYDGSSYVGSVDLPPGSYSGVLTAKLVPFDDVSRSIVGSVPVSFTIRPFPWLWVVFGGVAVFVMVSFVILRIRQ